MKHALLALAILLAASLAGAQSTTSAVCITGKVLPVPGPTICMQGETHYLENTGVYLKSSTLVLSVYEGQIVHLTGREIGVTCRVIEVTQVDPPLATLSWCGSPSNCCTVKLKLCPGALGRGVILAGTSLDFLPFACAATGFLDGTLLIRQPLVLWVGSTGTCFELLLPIPCSNALVGADVLFQGARQDIGPIGPLSLTNLERIHLAPFLPPCAPTNC